MKGLLSEEDIINIRNGKHHLSLEDHYVSPRERRALLWYMRKLEQYQVAISSIYVPYVFDYDEEELE